MQARKTHAQQLKIIEKSEVTGNAGRDFDLKSDLARNPSAKAAQAGIAHIRTGVRGLNDNRELIRGQSQEGPHHKRSGAGN